MVFTQVTGVPAAEKLLADARAAVPVLLEHAERTERERRIAPESLAAVREAGIFALGTPYEFGGVTADRVTTVRVLAELGRGCPSTAWVAAASADAKRFFTPLMPYAVRELFYTEPDVRLCGVGAPAGRAVEQAGTVRLSGRWGYASGCEDARWALLMAQVHDADGRFLRTAPVLVEAARLTVERTWDVAGMCGTGSHTLIADDVVVPADRVLRLPVGPDGRPELTTRPEAQLTNALCLIGPVLGAARGALDVVTGAFGTRRPPSGGYARLADSPGARQLLAEAVQTLRGAEQRALACAWAVDEWAGDREFRATEGDGLWTDVATVTRAVDQWAGGDDEFPEVERAGLWADLVAVTRECRAAVDMLLDLHGSSAFATGNPLQRYWRDLNVATRHALFTGYLSRENHGRLLVGER